MNEIIDNNDKKYKINYNDLINFIFPNHLQHPLAASRLIIIALFGPLDEFGRLRGGYKRSRVLMDFELEEMCIDIEKEDIIKIYLHKSKDYNCLLINERESILAQADGHLKRAKGKAYLPPITKQDVDIILSTIRNNKDDYIYFHELQQVVKEYRIERIKQYKLVYPQLISKSNKSTDKKEITQRQPNHNINNKKSNIVSETIAPKTMFMHMKGLRDADIVDQQTEYLNKHAYKIRSIGDPSDPAICANVHLIRDVGIHFKDPYVNKDNSRLIKEWDRVSITKGTSIGSLVSTIPSNTTWKRKYTSY